MFNPFVCPLSHPVSKLGCVSNALKVFTPGSVDATTLAKLLEQDYLIDYVGWRKDFLQPVATSHLTVLPVKSLQQMHWDRMAESFPETKGKYNDISDHYPVYAEFLFD